jgi:hypothetical protein
MQALMQNAAFADQLLVDAQRPEEDNDLACARLGGWYADASQK